MYATKLNTANLRNTEQQKQALDLSKQWTRGMKSNDQVVNNREVDAALNKERKKKVFEIFLSFLTSC